MNLLITGGTGFFGRALLRSRFNHEKVWRDITTVTVLSRNPDGFLREYPEFSGLDWLKFHRGDVLAPESLPTEQFTYVLHAAADSTLGATLTSIQRYDQIVSGTRNMLDFSVKSGATRFLLTSSGAVYGKIPNDMNGVDESYHGMPDSLDPANAYGIAKRAAEHLCALYKDVHGLNYVVARCFAFVGRDLPLNVHFAIGNFIRDALHHDEIIVKGDGTAVRSYLSQEDLATWLITLILHGETANAYNVGSDEAYTIAFLAHKIRDLIAPNKPVSILGNALSGERNIYWPNINKAKHALDLQVSTSLETAILSTAQHYQRKT